MNQETVLLEVLDKLDFITKNFPTGEYLKLKNDLLILNKEVKHYQSHQDVKIKTIKQLYDYYTSRDIKCSTLEFKHDIIALKYMFSFLLEVGILKELDDDLISLCYYSLDFLNSIL